MVAGSAEYAPPAEWSAPPSATASAQPTPSTSPVPSAPASARRHASTFRVTPGDAAGATSSAGFAGLVGPALKRAATVRARTKCTQASFNAEFSAAPLSAYDLYCRTLRSGGARQTGAQTRHDDGEAGVQTDAIPWSNKGAQAPDDLGLPSSIRWHQAYVAGKFNPYLNAKGGVRLLTLLRRVSLTVELLLEENAQEADAGEFGGGYGQGGRQGAPTSPYYAYSATARNQGTAPEVPLVALPQADAVNAAFASAALGTALAGADAPVRSGYVLGGSGLPQLLGGRPAVGVAVAPVTSLVAVAYGPSRHSASALMEGPGQGGKVAGGGGRPPPAAAPLSQDGLLQASVVVVWSPDALAAAVVEDESEEALRMPQVVLLAPGPITRIAWADARGRVLLGGGASGAVWVWDTHEGAGQHQHLVQGAMRPPIGASSSSASPGPRHRRPPPGMKKPKAPRPPPLCAFGIPSGLRYPTYTTEALGVTSTAVGGGAGDLSVTGAGHHFGDIVSLGLVGSAPQRTKATLWSSGAEHATVSHAPGGEVELSDSTAAALAPLLQAAGVQVSASAQGAGAGLGTPGVPEAGPGPAGGGDWDAAGAWQVASLDSRGVANVWSGVLAPVSAQVGAHGDVLASDGAGARAATGMRADQLVSGGWSPLNDTDIGVAPGGRLKLARSSTVACVGGLAGLATAHSTVKGVRQPGRMAGAVGTRLPAAADDATTIALAPAVPAADSADAAGGVALGASLAAASASVGAAALDDALCPLPLEGERASVLAVAPGAGSTWAVGRQDGAIGHVTRWGTPVSPRAWPAPAFCEGAPVTALLFSPWDARYLLAGYANGCLALFSTAFSTPVAVWHAPTQPLQASTAATLSSLGDALSQPPLREGGSAPIQAGLSPQLATATRWAWGAGALSAGSPAAVVDVAWSPTRPCVFWVLDASPALHVWDVSRDTRQPCTTVRLPAPRGSVVTGMALGGSDAVHVTRPVIAVSFSCGEVWCARVGPYFAVPFEKEGALWTSAVESGLM